MLLGCTKQHISYWSLHSYSAQPRKSLYKVVHKSAELFYLTDMEEESLANSAGLSLEYTGGDIVQALAYDGKIIELCHKASVSDRMLRLYKYKTPTKQTILALAAALGKSSSETDTLLRKYGYCLSESIVGDAVVKWYMEKYEGGRNKQLILMINETLDEMNLPLIMTKQL